MIKANLPKNVRYLLYKEACKTATMLDGLVVVEIDGIKKTRYEYFFGKNPKFAGHLIFFGEAGTVKTKTKTTPKLDDRGVQCMLVGYAIDHDGDVYRMWNPKTKLIHESRDVIWLNRMYYRRERPDTEIIASTNDEVPAAPMQGAGESVGEAAENENETDGTGSDGESESSGSDDGSDSGWKPAGKTTRSGRTVQIPKRYEDVGATALGLTAFETNYYAILQQQAEEEFEPQEIACVGAGLGRGFENTTELHVIKYNEAMAGPDKVKW